MVPEVGLVGLAQRARQIQAKAGALGFGGEERLEQALPTCVIDAAPLIQHREDWATAAVVQATFDPSPTSPGALLAMAHGVRKQIGKHLIEV